MCGITGIALFGNQANPDPATLQVMCDTLIHRGPDDSGMDIRDGVGLAMRRLSIIDLSGGKQPMFNEDRTVRTVFNGEIYNYRELRRDLMARGHAFGTNSDTETIVHAYEEFGAEFPKHLNGMFAIALHDSVKKRLYLVRDHIGIKPFYYFSTRRFIVWGSEIKAILASHLVKRDLDVDALAEYLAWEYVPGSRTLFKDLKKLEPAQMIELDLMDGSCEPRAYWDVPAQAEGLGVSEGDWEARVADALRDSVRRQLVSDVPLGAFLSGGVDSSLVVSQMGSARTFSIGFDDPSYNELGWARKVARHLGVEHVDDVIRPDVVALFDKLMRFLEDPIGDFSIFPTYLVSRHARRHVTVALSGDGGDELFGGYETYVADAAAGKYSVIPEGIRRHLIEPLVKALGPRPEKKGLVNKMLRFIEGVNQDPSLSHARWRIFAGEAARLVLFTPEALKAIRTPSGDHIYRLIKSAGDRDPVNVSLYVDLKSYLCDNCLLKVDRMSMANSLEVRVPYLDKEMVELAFQVPGRLKVRKGRTKVLLKKIAERHIPRECVYRPKEGFSIPIKNWLLGQLRPLMEELLSPETIRREGVFDAATVERLKRQHLDGAANNSHVLWSLMVFQAWRKLWLDPGSPAG
jgi:asparagine synthase (glutamine-hydrolysing)